MPRIALDSQSLECMSVYLSVHTNLPHIWYMDHYKLCIRRVVTLVMTAQNMSFRCELDCKGHSTEKVQDLAT